MAKILCVLYDDPAAVIPTATRATICLRSSAIPTARPARHPGRSTSAGATARKRFRRAGLRKFLEAAGHEFVVTSDKDGPDSEFERELADADVVISQPFWPAYMTAERSPRPKNLKLVVTAGIGSDHADLKPRSSAGSPSPRSPTATRSAFPSMW